MQGSLQGDIHVRTASTKFTVFCGAFRYGSHSPRSQIDRRRYTWWQQTSWRIEVKLSKWMVSVALCANVSGMASATRITLD